MSPASLEQTGEGIEGEHSSYRNVAGAAKPPHARLAGRIPGNLSRKEGGGSISEAV